MAYYSQDIINAKAVVFLGAGASCPLGFKDLDGLMKLAIGKIRESEEWLDIAVKLELFEAKDTPLSAQLDLEEFLVRLEGFVSLKEFQQMYDEQCFVPDFKEKIDKALTLRDVMLDTIREHFERREDSLGDVGLLYEPLFKLIREAFRANVVPVFTTNYDLALESFVNRCKDQGYHMVDGFDYELRGRSLPWDPNVYHAFSRSCYPYGDLTLALFKMHGSIFWKKREDEIIFSDFPTADRKGILDVLLYPTQTKAIAAEPYLTCYNYFEECLRKTKFLIAIGYSFGDDYLNQVIKRCQLANRNLRVLVFNPGFESPSRRQKFITQIGLEQERNTIYYEYFDKGERGQALLRRLAYELTGVDEVLQSDLHIGDELEASKVQGKTFGKWKQHGDQWIVEIERGNTEPAQVYFKCKDAIILEAEYSVEFQSPPTDPNYWRAGVWLSEYDANHDEVGKRYFFHTYDAGCVIAPRFASTPRTESKPLLRVDEPHNHKVRIEDSHIRYLVNNETVYETEDSDPKFQKLAITVWADGRALKAKISSVRIKWCDTN